MFVKSAANVIKYKAGKQFNSYFPAMRNCKKNNCVNFLSRKFREKNNYVLTSKKFKPLDQAQ